MSIFSWEIEEGVASLTDSEEEESAFAANLGATWLVYNFVLLYRISLPIYE